jgi:hypothetical protein
MRHLRDFLPRPPREVDKRGQILLIFGFIWTVIGVSVYQQPALPGYGNLLFSHIPLWLRAGAWIVTGVVAMAYALRPRVITNDGVGFLALYIMPAERAAIFLWGWVESITPGGGPGYGRGLLAGAVYLVLVAAVMVIATWPDPPLNPPTEDDQ